MRNAIAFDIDTQNDFMRERGALYVPGSEDIIPTLDKLYKFFGRNWIPIWASLDTHVDNDPEFAQYNFPPHCIAGSWGHDKIPETGYPDRTYRKNTFSVFSNPQFEEDLTKYNIQTAYVFGVALDYCVTCALDGLLERDITTVLITDATRMVNTNIKVEDYLAQLNAKGVKLLTSNAL